MKFPFRSKRSAFLAIPFLFGPLARAQRVDSIRDSYIIALPSDAQRTLPYIPISPGSSTGTPTAYGADWGDVFVGAGFQARMRYVSDTLPLRRKADGAADIGFGLGNSESAIGIEVNFTSFSTVRSGFFHHSTLSFKVHRDLPWNMAIAYGWEDAIRTKGTDGWTSMYGVLTGAIPLRSDPYAAFSTLTVSAGAGNGRFQREKAFYARENHLNPFGSVGLYVVPEISLIADWTGQDLMLGASLVPFPRIPFFITPSFADVTGSAGDGARFVIGVGLDFNFAKH
ncbi:MAG: hypothetical protein ACJ8AK_10700 [Gemmatimonadaceae bacterium]